MERRLRQGNHTYSLVVFDSALQNNCNNPAFLSVSKKLSFFIYIGCGAWRREIIMYHHLGYQYRCDYSASRTATFDFGMVLEVNQMFSSNAYYNAWQFCAFKLFGAE
jgi:hypothetical protein